MPPWGGEETSFVEDYKIGVKPNIKDFEEWWGWMHNNRGVSHLKEFALIAYRGGVEDAQKYVVKDLQKRRKL